MNRNARQLDAMIRLLRACFGQLRALGDALHRDLGVTAAMRAVMEFLDDNRTATVPEIAVAKNVSRQNIQILVDALIAAGLVETRPNPTHRRSVLIALTGRGRATFRKMRGREEVVLSALAGGLSATAIGGAMETLGTLRKNLELENQRLSQGGKDD